MALTPTIRASQAGAMAASSLTSNDLRVSMGGAMVVANFPTPSLDVSQAGAMVTTNLVSRNMRISQAGVMVVARGRIDSPKIRVFPFTLDEHDYYVLRLGNVETIVFDNLSREWSVYGSNDSGPWRALQGTNWTQGRRHAENWSDVIVGDDSNGALYFLSPDNNDDDDAVVGDAIPRPFARVVTGQVVVKPGYASVPCFGVQLFGSIGSASEDGLTVNLEVSDDRGHTYADMGDIVLDAGDYTARAYWPSLGSMVAPGRLFRIKDTGALKRIDALEME